MSLYNELKRRNVLRVAIAYLAGAWLLIEVTETLFPIYGFSDAAIRLVVTLLAIGFPILLIFSWVFELTPEGLKLEKDIDRSVSVTHHTSKKLDRVIIVFLALALGYFAFDKFVLDPQQDIEIAETAAQAGAEQALEQARLSKPSEKSIAVLAFANMSPDKDQEYFADGLSDTLIHVLAQVSGLKVTARNSSFYFKGKNIDVSEIARELKVGTILEGSVQKAGNRVRVIAQLINAGDGTHLWSKSFDRDLEDIFAVQDEIAQEVVKALKVTLLDTEEKRLAQRYQPTLEAYEQLILGRQEMAKRTAEGLEAAEQHFKQAIRMDPDYALAYVGLADTLALQKQYANLLGAESLERRHPLIEKALELDPLSGEAYTAGAFLHWDQNDFETAEREFLKAIELSPNYVSAYHWYANMLIRDGRSEEGLVQFRVAAELDPMAPIIQSELARAIWYTGRVEEALTLTRRNIEQNPVFPKNYFLMAQFQTELGHLGEAQRWTEEARKRNPQGARYWEQECLGFLHLGEELFAEDCANQFSETHPGGERTLNTLRRLHLYRGEWDAAIAKVEFVLQRTPDSRHQTMYLADLIARQGDVHSARRLMADAFPEYLEDELELEVTDLDVVLTFAAILHVNGETRQRDVLLLAMEQQIATMHRIRGAGYGTIDVYIHAMRGDRGQAITALREAIKLGWRASNWLGRQDFWWLLRQDWKLESLRQDPEFIALMNELEADIKVQRQLYEENKDKPLF
jgi:TolB-like protein/Tfp pilus assembly protein PilF